ncbi:other/AgaK1 protein kinase [Ephemerocybe angulata]|uniref:Other/AgaK1 protein kinase n=1 Tax=Ephemerocybe angulata TaxID=980116 RepID=A0A8H6HU82_9AGAR|nr:other/AgaK1 protein kinase [Tulosesus angulatus]
MKLVRLNSLKDTLYWTYRSWKEDTHIPNDLDSWTPIFNFDKGYVDADFEGNAKRWSFLGPFFRSHGYHLYQIDPQTKQAEAPASPSAPGASSEPQDPYPYARRAWVEDEELSFSGLQAFKVWPARDANGREVFIRLVAGVVPTDELKIYQLLNSPEARKDPRNHTLPVLDLLRFDGLVFVVMPRWARSFDCDGWQQPFNKVSELFDMAETFLEGLTFLHEHRIAHRDIMQQNTVMNLIAGSGKIRTLQNMRAKGAVRYAYIDFDSSIVFSKDVDLHSVELGRVMRAPCINAGLAEGLCNPFKDDVRCLGVMLELYVRHIEDQVPEIGNFFDWMVRSDDSFIPMAADALQELRRIRGMIGSSILSQAPRWVQWGPEGNRAFVWDFHALQNSIKKLSVAPALPLK